MKNPSKLSYVAVAWWLPLLLYPISLVLGGASGHAQGIRRDCGSTTVDDIGDPQFAKQARIALEELKQVAVTDDKKKFASLMHFPVRVFKGSLGITIKDSTDLVQKYSAVMTPEVKRAISGQSSDCLFGNADGVMVGKGVIWLNWEDSGQMKIVTFNLHAPS